MTKDQINFLDKICTGKWETEGNYINIPGPRNAILIDCKIDLELLKSLRFNNIEGYVIINKSNIDSLDWLPKKIGGGLHLIKNRNLKDLKGTPEYIGGNFECLSNSLNTLEGFPKHIKGNVRISGENIDLLKNINTWIGGNLLLERNKKITSLKGLDKIKVGNDIRIRECSLTSLEGAPKIINGDFNCEGNQLTNLVGSPKKINGGFICVNNPLISFIGAPDEAEDGFYFYVSPFDGTVTSDLKYSSYLHNPWNKEVVLNDIIEKVGRVEHLLDIIGPDGISGFLKSDIKILELKKIWDEVEKKEWYNQIKYPNSRIEGILKDLNFMDDFGL